MKVEYVYISVANIILCNLLIFPSEGPRESVISIRSINGTEHSVVSFNNDLYFKQTTHTRGHSVEILQRQGSRRQSLPTHMPAHVPLLVPVGMGHIRGKSSAGSSLHGISEEPTGADLNKTATRICANMNTSHRNALGRALIDGVREQFKREPDGDVYLAGLEKLSKTQDGQNRMMRQFLESYQCKCEHLVEKANHISKEEKVARNRVIQAAQVEASKKIEEVKSQKKKWKRIAVVSLGAAGAFGLIAVMQVLSS